MAKNGPTVTIYVNYLKKATKMLINIVKNLKL